MWFVWRLMFARDILLIVLFKDGGFIDLPISDLFASLVVGWCLA